MIRINSSKTYFKYFVLILPFLLLSCGGTDPVSPPETKTYTVTFETNGGSAIDSQTIADGEKAVKPTNDPTKDGYVLVGWTAAADGTGEAFDFDTPVTKDLTLYAIWRESTYTVTFDTDGGSEVKTQIIKEEGKKVTFVGANQADKAFVWWYTSATLDVNTRYDFDKVVTGDITLYAKWEDASKYTISDNKITYISDASGIVEIPYSVAGSTVTGVEGEGFKNIFGSDKNITVTQIILPNSVTTIENFTFRRCQSLTSIIIPDSVTSIGDGAFSFSFALTSITIPDSVTSIGDGAFRGCSVLMSITIPDSVTSIGDYTFSECISLTSITIPDSVTSIGDEAFSFSFALTSITTPDSVTSIGDGSFRGCIALMSITIPDSVTSIGDYTFHECVSLTSITIPDSVTSIGVEAFRGCSVLTSVTIGNSITSIGAQAFNNCVQLANVRVEGITPPTIKEGSIPGDLNIFRNTPSSLSITVPAASVEAYKAAPNWSTYADRITGY